MPVSPRAHRRKLAARFRDPAGNVLGVYEEPKRKQAAVPRAIHLTDHP